MLSPEFQFIDRFSELAAEQRRQVTLDVSDDETVVRVPPGMELILAVSRIAAGVDFPMDTSARAIGHMALAASLSKLAARGAEPAWATLALTSDGVEEPWIDEFAAGFLGLADHYGISVLGEASIEGALSVAVQADGFVPAGRCIRPGGARPGDLLYVTGHLGDAGMALLALQDEVHLSVQERAAVLQRLHFPEPRVAHGVALRGLASAATDTATGLCSALRQLLSASAVGATIHAERLPVSETVRSHFAAVGEWSLPLAAGGDYELCISVPADRQGSAEAALERLGAPCGWIGLVEATPGLRCVLDDGHHISH